MSREHWGDLIEVKTNIPLILRRELKTKKPGVVGISTVTDPYQPLEQHYSLTRSCLEELLAHDFPAHIQTKSALVNRDIDLISRFSDAQVMMSFGTLNDQERKLLEPCTSPIPERLVALKKYSDAGVKTAIFFGPIYPTITLNDIPCILDCFKESGVSELWIDRLNLKPGIWENISKKMMQNQKMYRIFLRNIFENKAYYQNIRKEIYQKGKERNLRIIDAF
jgi:DNA repair photolyase